MDLLLNLGRFVLVLLVIGATFLIVPWVFQEVQKAIDENERRK